MQSVEPDVLSKIQVSFVETLLYYYKVKPEDLKEDSLLLEKMIELSTLLYGIHSHVNEELNAELSKKTRVVEKNGMYFKVIDGDKKR